MGCCCGGEYSSLLTTQVKHFVVNRLTEFHMQTSWPRVEGRRPPNHHQHHPSLILSLSRRAGKPPPPILTLQSSPSLHTAHEQKFLQQNIMTPCCNNILGRPPSPCTTTGKRWVMSHRRQPTNHVVVVKERP